MKPYIGMLVHYFIKGQPQSGYVTLDPNKWSEPYAATICKIHSNGSVNLAVYNEHGTLFSAPNIPFIQKDEKPVSYVERYCTPPTVEGKD